MCGFAALIGHPNAAQAPVLVQRMLASIEHRGPDDQGTLELTGAVLGFRRLSILDLSEHGHQPMVSEDGNHAIVFNGEIYNYVELRRELEALGHRFRSSGDTEVLLNAYRQWGSDCLPRLNGMWALLIHDCRRNVLFGARDRFGIKPLFRWTDGRQTLLASEIKALRASGLVPGALNLERVASFLQREEFDTQPQSFFAGIEQIMPGHAFEISAEGRFTEWRFWDLDAQPLHDFDDAPARFAALFEDAMRIHMRSDVPVGVNLSGGLDSTSILCEAARIQRSDGSDQPLLAFAYRDARFDEDRYIQATLAQTGAQMVPLSVTPEQLWDSLPQMLAFQDEPVHTMTAIVGFHLSGLARRHGVKVVLNGQGADETLAGYGSYFRDYWYELSRSGQVGALMRQIGGYAKAHGGSRWTLLRQVAVHTLRTMFRSSPLYRTLAARAQARRASETDWISPALLSQLQHASNALPNDLRNVLSRSVRRAPLPLYLRIEDRNSMAHSVEVRLPFLDYRVVAFVHGLPAARKLNEGWNKQLLREGMRGRIPDVVRARVDKMGFPTSAALWFRGPLYGRLRDVFNDLSFRQQDLVDVQRITADLEAHRAGHANYAPRLFAAAQLHLWRMQAKV